MTSSLLILIAAQSPGSLFDRAITAHGNLKSSSVSVKINQVAKDASTNVSATLAFIRPDRVRLRINTPAAGEVAASDRSYTVVGKKLMAFDHRANEYILRDVVNVGSLANRLHSGIGQVDQPVSLILDTGEMRSFLTRFKTVPNWALTKSGDVQTLKASLPSTGSYAVKFSASTGRLLFARVQTKESTIEWSYTYSAPPKSISYLIPRGATKVEVFYDRQKPPAFADATARAIYEAGVSAYRRKKTLSYTVDDSAGPWTVVFSKGSISQRTSNLTVAWTSGTMTTIRGTKRSTIKCSYNDIIHELSKAKIPVEPTLRQLLQGLNPMERLLTGMKVKSSGSVSTKGVANHIIEGSKPGYRITIQQRGDSRLIAGTISEQLDARGNVIARAERRFTYR